MLRTAVAVFILGLSAAFVQAPPEKVDKAAAYYHFVLAHMYAEMADAASVRNSVEYEKKAMENYKLALKADPQTPDPRGLVLPFSPFYIPRSTPASTK